MLHEVSGLMLVGGVGRQAGERMARAYHRSGVAEPVNLIVMMTIMILVYDVQSLAEVFWPAWLYLAGARRTVRCRSIRFQPRASSAISRAWMLAEPSPVCQSLA